MSDFESGRAFEAIPGMEPSQDEVLDELTALDQLTAMNPEGLPIYQVLVDRREALLTNPQKYFEDSLVIMAEAGHAIDEKNKEEE
ncbi:hypothetical protein KC963_02700 [Candidatus Saccharibacteria bacterium]|nr:hypothetical protein [Candidatus Saccharibacteria bacterium]MCA9337269.1 hypothetical protein [Candidatus Saccharibacteria bacterium]